VLRLGQDIGSLKVEVAHKVLGGALRPIKVVGVRGQYC